MMKENVTGWQHMGIPTNDMDATVEFYKSIGFTVEYETLDNGNRVVFLDLNGAKIETYEIAGKAAGVWGAVDHIALNVKDLDKALEDVKAAGHTILEGPTFLPFYTNGVRFFNIEGPNKEKVEFNQML